MSAITKQSKNEQNSSFYPKKEKVSLKLSAVHAPADLPLVDDSKVPGAVVVAITNGKIHSEIVFHHPIGKTPLSSEKWIVTPISGMAPLLANAEDPSRMKKEKATYDLRLKIALQEGHYVKDTDGTLKLPPAICGGMKLSELRQAAETAHKNGKKEAHEKYLADCLAKDTKPKKDWKFGRDVDSYFPEEFKKHEQTFEKKFKVDHSEELKKIDTPYETMTGPHADQHQTPLVSVKDYTDDQMVDAIKRTLMVAARGDARFDVNPREARAAYDAAKTEEDLRKFIFKFCFPGFEGDPTNGTGASTTGNPT